MLKTLKILAISVYAVCGGLLVLFSLPKLGWKALEVATGSMTPAIPQGSLVLDHQVAPRSIKVGDVVTYINPANTKETITHRVVAVATKLGLPAFITRGDANKVADPEILGGNVVGKVEWHVPYLGKVISLAKQPLGLAILVIIPGILIIIDELRRLVKALSDPHRQPVDAPAADPHTNLVSAVASAASGVETPPKTKTAQHRPSTINLRDKKDKKVINLRNLLVLLAATAFTIRATQASLNSQATLTNNTIATATKANHLLISRVFLGGSGNVCPLFTGNSVTIIGTGPGSSTNVLIESSCHVIITNQTSVTIINNSSSNSQSGSTSSSGNTTGGSATSGSVSNTSSQTTTINIGSGSTPSSLSGQWFELHNPTSAAISLSGWTINDNSGVKQALPKITVAPDNSVVIPGSALSSGQIGNGLANAGDELDLDNSLGRVIDGLSWGSDTAVLNPSVAIIPTGGSAKRVNPDYDTDSAVDWIVQGP